MSTLTTTDPIILSAARWFWWIAGLSLLNTILFHTGSDLNFVVGLGMTTLADALFAGSPALAIGLAGTVLAFFFAVGLMAQRERLWAFYLGLAVYALDALIYVLAQDWMPVGFHALAMFYIVKGVMQLRGREVGSAAPAAEA